MRLYYKLKHKLSTFFAISNKVTSYEEKREIIKNHKEKYNIKHFIETGTFLGDTVEYCKDLFDQVISIELSVELADKAKKRFLDDNNVKIIQGDSGVVLKSLIDEINSPAIFWLDGHYSSEFFVGEEFIKTARANADTPIEEELKAIFSSKIPHIILIDDARLFTGIRDYPSISKIKKMVKKSYNKYTTTVRNDVICIEPISIIGKTNTIFDKASLKFKIESRFLLEQKWGIKKPSEAFAISKSSLRKYLPANPIIVDCGAHVGSDSIELCRIFPNSQIHAFEPVPDIFNRLINNTSKYKNIKCYPYALGENSGQSEMFVSSGNSDASSSLLKPTGHLLNHPSVYFDNTIKVNVFTLDEWAKNNSINNIDFLWLDMQGYELKMLQQSKVILDTVKLIYTEVSVKESYAGSPMYSELKNWLEGRGFKVVLEAIPDGTDMGNVLFFKN